MRVRFSKLSKTHRESVVKDPLYKVITDDLVVAWCSHCGESLPPNSKADFCEGEACREAYTRQVALDKKLLSLCANPACGAEMLGPRWSRRRYCCEACRITHKAQRRRDELMRALDLLKKGMTRDAVIEAMGISKSKLNEMLYVYRQAST